jgi:hypothetical protein
MGLYRPDRATVPACVSCHSALQKKKVKLGDILGIRSYRLVYSEDVALGNEELNANLNPYITAHATFEQTLSAVQSGGQLPLDPSRTAWKEIQAISDIRVQSKTAEIEKKLHDLEESVDTLLDLETNSIPYRTARKKIISESNALRNLSHELVVFYQSIAKKKPGKHSTCGDFIRNFHIDHAYLSGFLYCPGCGQANPKNCHSFKSNH